MGLVRASIVTGLCYLILTYIWSNDKIPISKSFREKYDKYALLFIIFFLESLW